MNLRRLKEQFRKICCGVSDPIAESRYTVKVKYNGKLYDISSADLENHEIVLYLDEGIKKWVTPGRPKMTQGSYPTYY